MGFTYAPPPEGTAPLDVARRRIENIRAQLAHTSERLTAADVAKIARRADASPSVVRGAILGRNVTVGVAVEIARALGVRVESIWSGPRPKRADARNARATASVEGA